MKGEVHAAWSHAEGCPAAVSVLDPAWHQQPQRCTCGMPDWFDLHTLTEIVQEALAKAVREGVVVIPGARAELEE